MKTTFRNLCIVGLATLSLGACSTSSERLGGGVGGAVVGGAVAGPVGAVVGGVGGFIEGPRMAGAMGVPHRGYRHHRHWRHHSA